jgi:hypothetical protein
MWGKNSRIEERWKWGIERGITSEGSSVNYIINNSKLL